MSYTKGPWKAINLVGYPRFDKPPFVENHNNKIIASFGGGNIEEIEANARLVAAAPELLEALERVLCLVDVQSYEDDAIFNQAESAIKKARGESCN